MSEIGDFFDSLRGDARWFTPGGLPEARLAELEAAMGRPLPPELRALAAETAGSEWAGRRLVQFFDDLAYSDVHETLSTYLPGTVAFASDGGPIWYLVDADDVLGRGAGAVWEVPAGAPLRSQARFIARDLMAFLEWMKAGD